MATYNEIVYNLKNLYRGGITSDDDTISNKQLIFIFNYYRAKLIREDLNKKRTIDRQLIQSLNCLQFECVDASECCEITDSGSTVLRSVNPLPKLLELHDKNLLLYVGTVDGDKPFQITTQTLARWSKYNKYTGKKTKAYLKDSNRYLYIINPPKGLEFVTVQGVFENPEEARDLSDCSGNPCFSYEDEYPVSAHMIPVINEMIMTKELKAFVTTPTDETNNTNQDAGQQ